MFFPKEGVRRQMVEYQALLDHEEKRLEALARVAGGVKGKEIALKLQSLRATRQRLLETFKLGSKGETAKPEPTA